MSVAHVELIVEEPSMEVALKELLPKILGEISFRIIVHQGKTDLLAQLAARLRGYARFIGRDWRIVVVVDRDDQDCLSLKNELETAALQAGLETKSSANTSTYSVINRIAVEELEAWYFGDWQAVRVAYPRMPPKIPYQARYRHPDAVAGGTWEAFERIAKRAGYFQGGLRKSEAAQKIATHMRVGENSSPSFQAFCSAIAAMQIE